MSASVELDELNLAGSTTHGILNMNVGSADKPNISVTPTTAVVRGTNSFIKYQKLHFLALNGVNTIANLRTWMTGSTNGETVVASFGGVYTPATFATPTQVALVGGTNYPVVSPPSPNLGISGATSGTITAAGFATTNTSDVWAWQVQTPNSIAFGFLPTKTFWFSWDES